MRLDPRLDWRSRHDERSRTFPVREVVPGLAPDRRLWDAPSRVLDQGQEGACVGHAWAAELASSPIRVSSAADNNFAYDLYRRAQHFDQWEGEDYSGTSVLAGAKACGNFIGEYRWAFSVEDLRDAVLSLGPAVIGIPWLTGMFTPRPSGLMDVGGEVAGGHAILVRGYHPRMRIKGEGWLARHAVFVLRQSWGEDYGKRGDIYVQERDLATLLADDGESCIPLVRRKTAL